MNFGTLASISRMAAVTYGGFWVAHRILAVLLLVIPMASPAEITWVGVPLGGGTARVDRALRIAERHPRARLLLAGTSVEVTAAQRWLRGASVSVEAYVVEPGTTYACAVALRRAAGDSQGLLVTDGSHLARTRLSWALAGGLDIPRGRATSPFCLDPEELFKFLGYLVRH